MYEHTFQHRVATSSATLSVAMVWLVLSWLFSVPPTLAVGGTLAGTAVTGILVAWWNDAFMLLRIRSRLISAWMLAFAAACPFMAGWGTALVPAACALGLYSFLFRAYQKPRPESDVFHAFVFLGVGSFFFPQWLYFVPFLWGAMFVRLRVYGLRVWSSAIVGLTLPYWIYGGYAAWQNRFDTAFGFLSGLGEFAVPDYGSVPLPVAVSFGFLTFYLVIASGHFSRTSYNDKIRVRMYHRLLTTQALLMAVLLIAQPQHYAVLFPLYVLTSSPIVGHYLALARGWGMNVWFVASLVLLVALSVFNHFAPWIPLSTF